MFNEATYIVTSESVMVHKYIDTVINDPLSM